jgi:hypothetical protein
MIRLVAGLFLLLPAPLAVQGRVEFGLKYYVEVILEMQR